MASRDGSRNRLSRWGWLGLISLVLVIRLAAAWLGRERLDADPDAYRTLGRIWSVSGSFAVPTTPLMGSEHEGIEARSKATPRYDLIPDDGGLAVRPTAYRPPLYPAILALLDRCGGLNRWGIGLLHVVLGLITAVLLASRLNRSLGWQAAMLGGVLVTCDPVLLSQGTLVMTETLATTLVVAGGVLWADAWQRRSGSWGVMAGVVLGLGALCRPPLMLAAAGSIAIVPLHAALTGTQERSDSSSPGRKRSISGNVMTAGGAILGIAVLLTPWTLRNLAIFGQPIMTTTHGGYTLLLANNHSFFDAMRTGQDLGQWGAEDAEFQAELRRADPDPVLKPGDELRQDERYRAAAIEVIRTRPGDFIRATGTRLLWFWGLSPHLRDTWAMRLVRGVLMVLYASMFLTAGYGLLRRRPQDGAWWSMLAVVVVLTGLHAVYWSNLRMRAPVVPFLVWTVVAALPWKTRATGETHKKNLASPRSALRGNVEGER